MRSGVGGGDSRQPHTNHVAGGGAVAAIVFAGILRMWAGTSLGFRPFDDTYISFRYAINLAAGRGFVYNFNESLNLKPLFLHIQRDIKSNPRRDEYLKRLNQVAEEVIRKQMLIIQDGGEAFDATIDSKNLSFPSGGEAAASSVTRDLVVEGIRRNVKLEVIAADPTEEGLQLRMTVRTAEADRVDTSSTEFWVGHFDFPMIDNTRLPHDQRLAAVLNNFDTKRGVADVTVALFPGKYAGMREKPYYDEVLAKLLAANRSFAADSLTPTPTPK